MAGLASRLAAGEPIGGPEDEGYLPRGLRSNVRADRIGAVRAIDLLLAKLAGDVRTEVGPTGDRVPPAARRDRPPVRPARPRDRSGLRAAGQPGSSAHPARERVAALPDRRRRVDDVGDYESVHAGFDTTAANADPNRLVPLDAARELERRGAFGSLHAAFYTTSGVDTPVATAAKFGQEIAAELREANVGAVILTGT